MHARRSWRASCLLLSCPPNTVRCVLNSRRFEATVAAATATETGRRGGKGYWQDESNITNALRRAEQQLGIQRPEDWYSITLSDLRALGYWPRALNRQRLAKILSESYSAHNWRSILFTGRYSQQYRLGQVVQSLFPDVEILSNARTEAGLVNPETGVHVELDIFLPALKLGFEFQEKHHYMSSGYTYSMLESVISKDQAKIKLARDKGITLIIVPYWWDRKRESLIATIKSVRPDLLSGVSDGHSIPTIPPKEQLAKHQPPQIDGVGEPTNACFFALSKIDPKGWWLFEKYDGVRGFWNPEKKSFFSRHGRPLSFPEEITSSMPNCFLDGEIWFGKENFQEAMKVVSRAAPSSIDWTKFKYMVFDTPDHRGKYEDRYEALVFKLNNVPSKYVQIAEKIECRDVAHVEAFYQDIVDKGGEGVILRDPNAPYQSGRCPGYLKHKKFRDAEAKIVAPAGLNQWECEMPDGVKFIASASSNEFLRRWDPKSGDIVTFKHRGFLLSTKCPKFPTIYRLRTDMTWDDVINNWDTKQRRTASAGWRVQRPRKAEEPCQDLATQREYFSHQDNRKTFFLDVAKQLNFTNPFDVMRWSSLSVTQLEALKGNASVQALLTPYDGSLKTALQSTFPELQAKAWPIIKKR